MKAVIVAAGRSSRLYPLTKHLPKGLLDVGGATLLGRTVNLLHEMGLAEVAIVVGFEADQIRQHLGTEAHYIHNPFFCYCNNMGSLWFARDWVGDGPFLYLHSDLFYHADLLRRLLEGCDDSPVRFLVDFGPVDEEAMKVTVDNEGLLVESNKAVPPERAAGEWVGMATVTRSATPLLFDEIDRLLARGELDAYDTLAFTNLARRGVAIATVDTVGLPWVEIDFTHDLERARRIAEEL